MTYLMHLRETHVHCLRIWPLPQILLRHYLIQEMGLIFDTFVSIAPW